MGYALARLWADLEDAFNPNIAVAIVVRWDMDPNSIPLDLIAHLKKKFDVFTHRSNRKGSGWPAGCNSIELGAIEWFIQKNRMSGFNYEYMLIAEADTVPLRKGWADEIRNEAYDSGKKISGAFLRRPDCGCEHINGNCVLHKDIWRECRNLFTCPENIGWDAYIGPYSISSGHASRLIWQDYRLGAPDNPWKGDDYLWETKFYKSDRTPLYGKPVYPAMIHGCKTMQGIHAARKKLCK